MPTFEGRQSGEWSHLSYKGIPIASGKLQQWYNLYNTLNYFQSGKYQMPSFRKRYNYISRNNKRQRVGRGARRWNRGAAKLGLWKKKRGTSGKGLTFEHDRQGMYRKKSMPRRMKRRWGKFVKKVSAVSDRTLGNRTVLFNVRKTFNNAVATDQLNFGVCLYGWNSTHADKTWYNDLQTIASLENDQNPTSANDATVSDQTMIMFKSGVLDITLRNTSFKSGAIDPDCTLETDVYEIRMKSLAEMQNVNYQTLHAVLNLQTAGIWDQAGAGSLGTPIKIDTRGATPFECTIAQKAFGMKVMKKTKFFVRAGQTVTYQVRDPKNRKAFRKKLEDGIGNTGSNTFNKPGWTRLIYIIAKAVPGITIGAAETTEQIDIGVTRKYMYKIRGINESRTIQLNQ